MRSSFIKSFNFILLILTLISGSIDFLEVIIPFLFSANVLILISNQKKLVSVGLLFFSLLTLFHCAKYTVLTDAGFEDLKPDIEFHSLKFSISCIICFIIGYYHKHTANRDFSDLQIELPDQYISLLRKIAMSMLLVTIVPAVYFDIQSFKATLLYGYGAMYHLSETNDLIKYGYIITPFFKHSILLLLLSYYKEKNKALIILLISVSYLFITMLSGARINALIYVIIYSFIYIKIYIKKINLKNILLLGSIIVAIIIIIPSISNIRGSGDMSLSSIQEASNTIRSDKGTISSFAEEFGDTQITMIYSMMFTDTYNCGLTYPLSFLQISPKLPPSWMDFLSNQFMYTESFPAIYKETLGGSCIGEAYYNFGWLGLLFFFFVGMFVKRLDSNICSFTKNNYLIFIIYISILPGLIMWVRGAFYQIIYIAFWVPFICNYYYKKIKKYENITNN